jgi:hypothetical protein
MKGAARPVNPLGDRLEVLAALEMVDSVTSFVLTTCGVNSMMRSICDFWLLLPENTCFRNGTCMAPGTPWTEFVSSSRSSPASRFDSPSRSRRRVPTARRVNGVVRAGDVLVRALRVALDVEVRRMSPSSVTRGVMSILIPTSLSVKELSGFTPAPLSRSGYSWS